MSLQKLTQQIFERFDQQIVAAVRGTSIPPSFVAGLIANESGRDKAGWVVPTAIRFEPHVFRALVSIRDNGYRVSKGKIINHYNYIRKADIHDASDSAIRALSTSWGITQIMGWHCLKNLRCTIADLRDPAKHLLYTVKLLQLNGFPSQPTETSMDREMREWNTGREDGKTYHANYVPNAKRVREIYKQLEKSRANRTSVKLNLSDPVLVTEASTSTDVLKGMTDQDIDQLLDGLSTDPEPRGSEYSLPAGPTYQSVEETAGLDDWGPVISDPNSAAFDSSLPHGDSITAGPSKWISVEDWKPFAVRWLKCVWGLTGGAWITQGIALFFQVFEDPTNLWMYAAIAIVVTILLISIAAVVSIVLIAIWLLNRREINSHKLEEFQAMTDPNRFNVALAFEKK